MGKRKVATGRKKNGNGANLGFEVNLWLAADKLRNNRDAAEYKYVDLGLILLKYHLLGKITRPKLHMKYSATQLSL